MKEYAYCAWYAKYWQDGASVSHENNGYVAHENGKCLTCGYEAKRQQGPRFITCTTCNVTHDVTVQHVCARPRWKTLKCAFCGSVYFATAQHACKAMRQPPNFLSRKAIADLVEGELRETREVLMIREMRESCMALVQHLEEIGYLASSESPEMMADAWDRVLYDVTRVQEAELAIAIEKESIAMKWERVNRAAQKVGSEAQIVTVDELLALEKKIDEAQGGMSGVNSILANLVVPGLDLSEDVAKDDGSPLGGRIL